MNIIIIGCGRFGSALANEFSDAGYNISVVDRDGERLNILGSGFNGLKIKGIEYDDEVLREAGISTADALLAVTPDENINITVSLIAKKIYKVPRIIARIVNANRKYIYEKLDIETINLIQLGVDILKAKLLVNKAGSIAIVHKDYEVAEIYVSRNKTFTVRELEEKFGCVISGIVRNGDFMFPQKADTVTQGETIICTIGKKNLDRIISAL
jgi:trk system potassium uptake protein TrkA